MASLADLDRDWTYGDMLDAHALLDAIAEAVARDTPDPRGR